ncbi:MAG: alanine--tRNA ligase [Defluviitaleaceae bacterium]|nr:alanine--tRNA ligase [Defluviitaleaceae bacterium]
MKNLGLNELRGSFLSFFEGKNHYKMASFPLVPQNDKSLLLINAGMAPLKPYFTGQETPPSKRVTTCQKCMRTGDIDNVGKTTRHGTFFEMLGNFSFGDYFKEESIVWAWEFVTEIMEIPIDKLHVSIYLDDDESFDIWHQKIGLPKERITRLGKEDNFWEVGVGPCGPCSEIYYDKGVEYGCDKDTCAVGCDCERYMEFWNLVFTQFDKQEDGSYAPLEKKSIDTGMGLERLALLMQGVHSIFDIDTLKIIRDDICKAANVKYGIDENMDVHIRVITDHIRAITFMTADGVMPSGEGRGYVFRKLLRRALRHGQALGILNTDKSFLADLSEVVIKVSGDAYPELSEKRDHIHKIIAAEEQKFNDTIRHASSILKDTIEKMTTLKGDNPSILDGQEAFKLYDTYGLPLDIMKELLEEHGITVDETSFSEQLEKQRERARAAREETGYMGADTTVYHKLGSDSKATEFTGYENIYLENAKIVALISGDEVVDVINKGMDVSVITDKTSFYAEKGGQKGDIGIIKTENGEVQVTDCILISGEREAHIGTVTRGSLKVGDITETIVDKNIHLDICRNHTATHLVHKALKEVAGSHVEQAGSSLDANRLRFDFTNFEPLSREMLDEVERKVNEKILECLDISSAEKSIAEAKKEGASALFGEKYGEIVRVVNVSDYSIELCGGTHVKNTSELGCFAILSETGIASGVRRIEAVTGKNAINHYKEAQSKLLQISEAVKTQPQDVVQKVNSIMAQIKEQSVEISKMKSKMSGGIVDELISNAVINIKDIPVITAYLEETDVAALREHGDKMRDKLGTCVVALAAGFEGKISIVVMATDDVVKKGIHAGNIAKEAIAVVGGKGGGKANVAQAGGGVEFDKIEAALAKAREVIEGQL